MQYTKKYTFKSISVDINEGVRPKDNHKLIVNMDTFFNEDGIALKVSKGTREIIASSVLQNSFVIGHGFINDVLYIFTTDNTGEPNDLSIDSIFKVIINDSTATVSLVQTNNWQFSTLNPIDCKGLREHENSEKLYWVDSYNQARFINVLNPSKSVDFVKYDPTPGVITAFPYGVVASKNAVVRYAFTQYNVGGSESKISSFTGPINISTTGDSANVIITGLSDIYSSYRVYRVSWDSYNGVPQYDIIQEGAVPPNKTVSVIDGGNVFIKNISIEEFIDIGSDLIIPATINTKKQKLFLANYKVKYYDPKEDLRAFAFSSGGNNLGAPVAIGPTEEFSYTPVHNNIPSRATLKTSLDPSTVYTQVVNIQPEPKPFEDYFQVVGSNVWLDFNRPDNTYLASIDIQVYDINDHTYSNELGGYYHMTTGTGFININLNPPGGGYRFKCTYPKPLWSPGRISMDIGLGVVWSLTYQFYYADLNQANGFELDITSFLPTTQLEVFNSSGISVKTTPDSITDFGTYAEVVMVYPTGLYLTLNNVSSQYTGTGFLYPILYANVTGTKREILGGVIRLKDIQNVETDYSTFNGIPLDHDAINPDPSVYNLNSTGTIGAEGPIVKLEVTFEDNNEDKAKQRRFKQGETYRVGVVIKDHYGRLSPTKWVCDLKIPYVDGGDSVSGYRKYASVKGMLKSMPDGAASFKFVYVERSLKDKSILFSGCPQTIMQYERATEVVGVYPFPQIKEVKTGALDVLDLRQAAELEKEMPGGSHGTDYSEMKVFDKRAVLLYTPETFLYNTNIPATGLRLVGVQEMNTDKDVTRMELYKDAKVEALMDYIEYDPRTQGFTDTPDHLFDDYRNDPSAPSQWMYWMWWRQGGLFKLCTQKDEIVEYCRYLAYEATLTFDSSLIHNSLNIQDFSAATPSEGKKANYTAEHTPAFLIKMNSVNWAGSTGYENFLTGVNTFSGRGLPIVDVLQNVTEQYGGNSLESKSINTYIDASEGSDKINTYVELFGDIYNGYYTFPKTTGTKEVSEPLYHHVYDYIGIAMESSISVDLANKLLKDINGGLDAAVADNLKLLDIENLLTYNTVFSQLPNSTISPSKPFNFIDIAEYPTRINPTNTKFPGELVDSWTKVNTDTYIDLESVFGPISSLVRVVDSVIAFQSKAIAAISILPNKQVATNTGNIQLGKGSVLDDFQYITTEFGATNRQAIAVFQGEVFFIDSINKTLNTLNEGEISIIKGYNSVTQKYMNDSNKEYLVNNADGSFVWIDNNKKLAMFKFANGYPVLAYNFITGDFTQARTYKGYYYVYLNGRVVSAFENKLYENDKGNIGFYYDELQPAWIESSAAPLPDKDKVFDALVVDKKGESMIDIIEVNDTTDTSGEVPANFKDKFGIFTAYIPRVYNSRAKFRTKFINYKLVYNDIKDFVLKSITVKFTIKK